MDHNSSASCENKDCCCVHGHSSAQQSFEEVDFSRGIWAKAMNGNFEAVRHMLDKRLVDANLRDNYGYTAMVCAILLVDNI